MTSFDFIFGVKSMCNGTVFVQMFILFTTMLISIIISLQWGTCFWTILCQQGLHSFFVVFVKSIIFFPGPVKFWKFYFFDKWAMEKF